MAIKIGSILIDIQADTAKLVSGMQEAQKKVGDAFSEMKHFAAEFAAAVGVGLSLEGLVEFVKHAAETQVQMAKLAAAAGVSGESFSELAYVAKVTGTPIEALAKGLQFLDKNMVSAASGNQKFVDLFRKIGVDAVDPVTGQVRDAGVVFTELRDKLGQMGNQSEAAGIRMKLLGRGSGELAYMMGLSKEQFTELTEEAHRFGFVIDDQSRNVLLQYEEQMNRLRLEGEGMATQFAVGLAPALIDLANGFANAIGGATGFRAIGAGVGEVIALIAKAALSASAGLDELAIGLKKLYLEQKQVNDAPLLDRLTGKATLRAFIGPETPEQQALSKQLDDRQKKFEADMVKLANGFNFNALTKLPRTGATPDLTPDEDTHKLGLELDKLSEKTRKLLDRDDGDKYARLLGDINQQLQAIGRFEAEHPERIWTNLNKQAIDLTHALTDVEGKQRLILAEALVNSEKPLLESILKTPVPGFNVPGGTQSAASLLKLDSAEGTADRNRLGAELFNQTQTAAEKYQHQIAQLDIELAHENITQETYNRAVRDARETMLASIDPLVQFQKRYRELSELQAAGANPLAIKAADFDNLQRFRQEWEQILIKQNTFGTSLHAALLHAAADGEAVGAKLAAAFTKAIDGLNQGLTDLAFGDKTNFGQVLKNFGKDIFKANLEKTTGQIFGKLGDVIPGLGDLGLGPKPDGTESNPWYVRIAGGGGGLFSSVSGGGSSGGGIWGKLGSIISNIFGGGGSGGGDVFAGESIASFPFLAGGGFLGEGEWGVVGENGPEFARGGRGGTSIIPSSKMKAGGDIYIDARGADAGVEMRVMRAIHNSKNQAVRESVMAVEERRMRTVGH